MEWTLVTGGAKGLGAEICIALAKQGMPLLIHYNTSEVAARDLKQTCLELGAEVRIIQGDFSTLHNIQKFTSDVLQLNLPIKNVINNVGNYLVESALKTTVEDWHDLFLINVHAPFVIINVLADTIRALKGRIINIGVSGLNSGRADTYSSAYTITKKSLLCLTRSLAKELAPEDVTVNMVSPGHLENSVDLPQNKNIIPMKRPARFDEITDMVTYLLSEKGRYITGQNIEVAGGVRI